MTETSLPVLELNPAFAGTTIWPGSAEYEAARAVYNGSIDRHPAVILRPTGAADVADAVNYARDARLPLTVRCDTAIAQGGALWGEYVAADRTGAVHLNFEPGTSSSDVHAGFRAERYARLAALKAPWDPTNLFRSNHNIQPAG